LEEGKRRYIDPWSQQIGTPEEEKYINIPLYGVIGDVELLAGLCPFLPEIGE